MGFNMDCSLLDIKQGVKWYRSHYRMDCPEFTRWLMKLKIEKTDNKTELNEMIDNEIDRFYNIRWEYIQGELF